MYYYIHIMSYKQKYLKYKTKYINYKNFLNGGAKNTNSTNDDFSLFTDEDENNKQSEKNQQFYYNSIIINYLRNVDYIYTNNRAETVPEQLEKNKKEAMNDRHQLITSDNTLDIDEKNKMINNFIDKFAIEANENVLIFEQLNNWLKNNELKLYLINKNTNEIELKSIKTITFVEKKNNEDIDENKQYKIEVK